MVLLMLLVVVLRVLRMLRVVLLVVLDRAGPRVMLRMVGWRWQALLRVGVMLVEAGTSAMSGRQQQRQRLGYAKTKRGGQKRFKECRGRRGDAGGDAGRLRVAVGLQQRYARDRVQRE
jgi:hypothetical protein